MHKGHVVWVDINNEDTTNNFLVFVWEPAMVHIKALTAVSEAVCLIASVDDTIKIPCSTIHVSGLAAG